jgi:hypothetical protein
VLVLPFATCLSDAHVAAIRAFVEQGGGLVADGRAGLLTGNGVIRDQRPLDELFGVTSPAGREALVRPSVPTDLQYLIWTIATHILEPELQLAGAEASIMHEERPLWTTHMVGEGQAVLINAPFRFMEDLRSKGEEGPVLTGLGLALGQAGMRPHAKLMTEDAPARCVEQVLFTEGDLRYLCLEQDILQRGLGPQEATLTLREPAFVYDVRAGKQIGEGQVQEWPVTLSRGRPHVFALLPYEVTGLTADVPADARAGGTLPIRAQVAVDPGEPQFHVVHVSVYPPGSDQRHRQYSQSIECPGGSGEASIAFALDDPEGEWRLELKDVASGTTVTRTLQLRAR